MRIRSLFGGLVVAAAATGPVPADEPADGKYPIVGTGQKRCYDDRSEIAPPRPGEPYFGQDAQHPGTRASYRDNGDGTVSDLVTGLTWVRERGAKVSWAEATKGASACRVGGHADWRVPTIKQLYSLIHFEGGYPGGREGPRPFLDAKAFEFRYGEESKGERAIDCQDWSATKYVGRTIGGDETVFGVNFADGRIKGYPVLDPRTRFQSPNRLYVRYVRGNPDYGVNRFEDRGDGTVLDRATGLLWQQQDSGTKVDWKGALACAAGLSLAGKKDWRLPNAKELQSLVDYSRSPTTTKSAAIDPVFRTTDVESYFWTSTTHLDGPRDRAGARAVYVAFGRAMGFMGPPGGGPKRLMDVHGAGAQRSDPKSGDPSAFPEGMGPQGDDIRIRNAVRCVRGP